MPALIFTKENPFKLSKIIRKNKSKAPIKPKQVAPSDIVVPAGPTSFAPGPIIGELGAVGIKAGVEAGKIAIKQDAVVAKEGDVVSSELASILTRLGIEPMEIGLNLTAVYEDGQIYESDLLQVDAAEYQVKISTAYSESLNLAVYIVYTNEDTLSTLLNKAEEMAQTEYACKKILVTSALGSRRYFMKLGYSLEGPYMSKKLEG